MPISFNELETKRFGVRCAHITEVDVEFSAVERAAARLNIQFLSVRVPTDNLAKVHELEGHGFLLMDTLVCYSRSLDTFSAQSDDAMRPSTPEDAEEVAKVARLSFSGYFGHYHADQRLSGSDADEVYVDWAENSIRDADATKPATIMTLDGKIVSFLTMKIEADTTGKLILVGVLPDFQGQGVYGRVIDHGLVTLKERGCSEVITSTQINNIPVQKAWGKRGFRTHSSFYTLHKWMDASENYTQTGVLGVRKEKS